MSLKKNKYLWGLSALIIMCTLFFRLYVYKKHDDPSIIQPVFKGSTFTLIQNLSKNDSKWIKKTVELHSTIISLDSHQLSLEGGATCILAQPLQNKKPNESITIYGQVLGYDALFKEIKLHKCHLRSNL